MSEEPPKVDPLAPRNRSLSDEAIDWVARLTSGEPDAAERAAFEAWRNRSPAHAHAASEAASILHDIAGTQAAADHREIGAAMRYRPHRMLDRRGMLAGGVVAATVAGVVASGILGPGSALWSDYATAIGGRKRVDLADGSVIWLNTASALSVDYRQASRNIILHAGEALFQVRRDPARPFVVHAGAGEAQALGTVYAVRRHGETQDVTVSDGLVAVRSGSQTVHVGAGQQVSYGQNIISAVRQVDSGAATAWARGKLIFNHRPLSEVAAELERYQYGKVILRSESLKALRVTGVFDLDDPAALLRAVSETAQVPVRHYPWLTLIG
ncbi:FecR family protein [Novosphingobium terrae]|uniref:FecR family protein n=1 Tax=Novosphingobium terrae TaxID=2726189 RepID=UPI00197F01EF|nr:FecR domain-containing protein [Novosphingobium terrae]